MPPEGKKHLWIYGEDLGKSGEDSRLTCKVKKNAWKKTRGKKRTQRKGTGKKCNTGCIKRRGKKKILNPTNNCLSTESEDLLPRNSPHMKPIRERNAGGEKK